MNVDPRCCGSGTCIINAGGECWCGQQWDGEKMCMPELKLNIHDSQEHDSTTANSQCLPP